MAALAMKRAEVEAIVANTAPPSFENTAEALEDCGRPLARVLCVYRVYAGSLSLGDMPAVAQRMAPLLAAQEDEMAHDERLHTRLNSVWRGRGLAGLHPEQQRLLQVLIARMQRRGAALAPAAKARLAQIQARLAQLSTRCSQNLIHESDTQAVFIANAAGLHGLPEAARHAASAAAAAKGRPGEWAINNARGAVWPFLTLATRRDLREQVWRMWTNRGDNAGAFDNKPIAAEILSLRGEQARLMGEPSYAHLALADRMARTPQAAMILLQRTWQSVRPAAQAQLADYQALADKDAGGTGAGARLAPWDRQFYAERLRRERFGLDGDAVKAYLPLDAVLQAMFWAAGRVHGLNFEPLDDAPVIHPSVRVYAVNRGAETVGVLYFDLFHAPASRTGPTRCSTARPNNFAAACCPSRPSARPCRRRPKGSPRRCRGSTPTSSSTSSAMRCTCCIAPRPTRRWAASTWPGTSSSCRR